MREGKSVRWLFSFVVSKLRLIASVDSLPLSYNNNTQVATSTSKYSTCISTVRTPRSAVLSNASVSPVVPTKHSFLAGYKALVRS